jgi:hypothetical protein
MRAESAVGPIYTAQKKTRVYANRVGRYRRYYDIVILNFNDTGTVRMTRLFDNVKTKNITVLMTVHIRSTPADKFWYLLYEYSPLALVKK